MSSVKRNIKPLNVVFSGNFLYPEGMAETKRVQYFVDAIKAIPGYSASVLLYRQGHPGRDNSCLSGEHNSVPYQTIGSDLAANWQLPWTLLKYLSGGLRYLWRCRRGDARNVLFLYGRPNLETFVFVLFARLVGYKVVVDVVEDFYLIGDDVSVASRLKAWSTGFASNHMHWFADAMIVISTHLQKKFKNTGHGRFTVDLISIAVDLNKLPGTTNSFHHPVRVFYAGNFAEKDGVENLIDAFEVVARNHSEIELLLTGKGMEDRMSSVLQKIDSSPFRQSIHYLGFLPAKDYFAMVGGCDIPCVIRVASDFAARGFPFKLGEYLAAGRPVIVSALGDVTDFLVDRESAYLVEAGNTNDVVQVLEYLIENEAEALAVGRTGRQVAIENFDAIKNGAKFVSVLEGLS